jgi:hypothetical protein
VVENFGLEAHSVWIAGLTLRLGFTIIEIGPQECN